MPESLLDFWRASPDDPFQVFFQHAPIMMHSIDANGILVNVSKFWADALGYETHEMIGRASVEFLTPESRIKAETDTLLRFMSTRQIHNVSYDFVKKNGRILPVILSATAEFDTNGRYVRSLAVIFDNTEAALAHDALREKAKQAEAASLAKSAFLATMSHEIRTPLNGVMGMSAALSQTPITADQADMVDTILSAGKNLNGLLSDVLDLAKIESGEMRLERSTFIPADLCGQTTALFMANAQAKGIALSVETDDISTGSFIGARSRIQQVLSNLISNAVKFTASGSVSVRGVMQPGEAGVEPTLVLTVADTGIGVAQAHQGVIFEAFDQGDAHTGVEHGGTGLGLAIARVICRHLGGDITVQDTPGGGATFIATMRVESAVHGQDAVFGEDIDPVYPALTRPLNLLVVDDNEMNRKVMEALLMTAPASAVFVDCGQAALEILEATTFDAALIDIRMPTMSGMELAEHIRTREDDATASNTPLIAFTANVMKEQMVEYESAGFDYSLSKPIQMTDLARCLSWIDGEIAR